MFKEINDAIRSKELEHTYIISETVYGSFKLQHCFTNELTELSFFSVEAALKYANTNNLQIKK